MAAAADVRSIEQVEGKVGQGYAGVAAFHKGTLEGVFASSQAAINGYQALSAEVLAFVQSRMKEGLEHGRQLAACHSPEAALAAQADFVKSVVRAYGDELGRLGDLGGKIVRDSLAPLQARARSVSTPSRQSAAA